MTFVGACACMQLGCSCGLHLAPAGGICSTGRLYCMEGSPACMRNRATTARLCGPLWVRLALDLR